MRETAKEFFKDETGLPIVLTDGQCEIFALIFKKMFKRNHIMTYTQFGKSFSVALAVLTRVATFPEKWCIVAGKAAQAQIIMSYIIQHCFDNEYTKSKLTITKEESIEALKRERSKNRLTFRHADGLMGEVFVLSADAKNKQEAGNAVMGFGAPNIVLDEAALVDDDIEAKIFRMLGAQPENFYFKIGNPFRNNHFRKDFENPNFHHVNIDWRRGIMEGRTTFEFIEEAKKKPLFDILYENKFGPKDVLGADGYVNLITEDEIITCDEGFRGEPILGIDPAADGSDEARWVVRDALKAECVAMQKVSTPKSGAEETVRIIEEYGIRPENVYIDSFGEGAKWIPEIARQKKGCIINAVNVGDKLDDDWDLDNYAPGEAKKIYFNMRAYAYTHGQQWVKAGGKFVQNPNWKELTKIRSRANSSRQIQIEPKKDLLSRNIPSPNTADAWMLTFCGGTIANVTEAVAPPKISYDEHGRPQIEVDNNPLGL